MSGETFQSTVMTFDFVYTPEDFAGLADPGADKSTNRKPITRPYSSWILFAGLALFLYLVLRSQTISRPAQLPRPAARNTGESLLDILAPSLIIAAFLLYLAFKILSKWQLWKLRQIDALMKSERQQMRIDEEGVALRGQLATTQWPWSAFRDWQELERYILLVISRPLISFERSLTTGLSLRPAGFRLLLLTPMTDRGRSRVGPAIIAYFLQGWKP